MYGSIAGCYLHNDSNVALCQQITGIITPHNKYAHTAYWVSYITADVHRSIGWCDIDHDSNVGLYQQFKFDCDHNNSVQIHAHSLVGVIYDG